VLLKNKELGRRKSREGGRRGREKEGKEKSAVIRQILEKGGTSPMFEGNEKGHRSLSPTIAISRGDRRDSRGREKRKGSE